MQVWNVTRAVSYKLDKMKQKVDDAKTTSEIVKYRQLFKVQYSENAKTLSKYKSKTMTPRVQIIASSAL
jgi:hypothetical protein